MPKFKVGIHVDCVGVVEVEDEDIEIEDIYDVNAICIERED